MSDFFVSIEPFLILRRDSFSADERTCLVLREN